MSKYKTLSILILWRIISVFLVQTAHVPDEYWQSLEVAHRLAFGYGYLTWEWFVGIRSYMYPFLISILYNVLECFHLDNVEMLIITPKLLQAFLSGYADYRFYLWTNKSRVALFCLVFNWYWYYCATRTLINTVETTMTIIALSIFPWKHNQSSLFLWVIGFLCLARPTAAITWLPIYLYYIWNTKREIIYIVIIKSILIGAVTFIISTAIDILLYKRIIFTFLEFLQLNVNLKISDFYGVESYGWYFYIGLPVVLGLQYIILPFTGYHVFKRSSYYRTQFVLLITIIWTLFVYSLLPHKEFRFILPLLPMLIYVTTTVPIFDISRKTRKKVTILFVVYNLIPGLYFSLVHQRGPLDVMQFLRQHLPDIDSNVDLLFLTPCHANPLYSHLHRNISARFLTCEPNLNNTENYFDEADKFYNNPMLWLNKAYENTSKLPSHLIVFDNIINEILPFLDSYNKCSSIFYAHFTQGKYGNNIVIYKRKIIENNTYKTEDMLGINERLDNLLILNLDLMEQKVAATVEMEKSLRNAQIELAKAKLIRGKESIGTTQIPIYDDNITSLFELESMIIDVDGYLVPQFDISLKQSNEKIQNPLKWFGILVPQSLKLAQKYFQDSIYQSVKLANIQSRLIGILDEIDLVKGLKGEDKQS